MMRGIFRFKNFRNRKVSEVFYLGTFGKILVSKAVKTKLYFLYVV